MVAAAQGSGALDFVEFSQAVLRDGRRGGDPLTKEELREIFEFVDVDGDGSVSLREFREFLQPDGPGAPPVPRAGGLGRRALMHARGTRSPAAGETFAAAKCGGRQEEEETATAPANSSNGGYQRVLAPTIASLAFTGGGRDDYSLRAGSNWSRPPRRDKSTCMHARTHARTR